MAIQESDYIDFGNGIIGDDTFDVWRKKTNSLKIDINNLDTNLSERITEELTSVDGLYVPLNGSATLVETQLSFNAATTTFNNKVSIGGGALTGNASKITSTPAIESSIQLTAPKIQAVQHLILGTKVYDVPGVPSQDNAVLVTKENGELSWKAPGTVFDDSGANRATTQVFEEVMPVGTVVALAGEINDPNFQICNGGTLLKEEYPDLFEVIKYKYDEGLETVDGGARFALPNYDGRVPVGIGSADGVSFGETIGAKGGTSNTSTNGHALSLTQIPPHSHSYRVEVDSKSGPTLECIVPDRARDESGTTASRFGGILNAGGNASGGTDAHSHVINAENRVQPYITVKWYIKAVKSSKIDFIINTPNDSALEAKDTSKDGNPIISDITPIDGTVQLKVKTDETSIAIFDNELRVKKDPVIEGSITADNLVIKNFQAMRRDVDNGSIEIRGGSNFTTGEDASGNTGGGRLFLFGNTHSSFSGQFFVDAKKHSLRNYAGKKVLLHLDEDGTATLPESVKPNPNATPPVTGTFTSNKSIVTKEYLAGIFNLSDAGVLTINVS